MYDATTRHAIENLDKVVAQYHAGEANGKSVLIAAKALLRVTSPEAVEDREYYEDLAQPEETKCGAISPPWTVAESSLKCSRRVDHVSPTHRDCEITWTDEDTKAVVR